MRILLIEDSVKLQRSISAGLRNRGFRVDVTGDGTDGLWRAQTLDYDAIILDLMLPGLDGLSLLRELRRQKKEVHVLILSARDTVEDRVTGLSEGADDYLIKPFAFEELLARVQALIRRRYGIKQTVIPIGRAELDLAGKSLVLNGVRVELPPREYALFELLALKRGAVVSRKEIEEHIYDDLAEPSSNVVDAAVCSLRKLLDIHGIGVAITTRRGMGYLID
ncbi:MAG: response regulator [bacterium]|nr:response regulator [bacterium]